jgi:hypothetical protein
MSGEPAEEDNNNKNDNKNNKQDNESDATEQDLSEALSPEGIIGDLISRATVCIIFFSISAGSAGSVARSTNNSSARRGS